MPLSTWDITNCCCGCVIACGCCVPKTLSGTHSVAGAFTLNWVSGTVWKGTSTYAYPGCCSCPAGSVTLSYTLTCSAGSFSIVYTWHFTGMSCPNDAGAGNGTSANSSTCLGPAKVCSPFSLSFTNCGGPGLGNCASTIDVLLCTGPGGALRWSITITA